MPSNNTTISLSQKLKTHVKSLSSESINEEAVAGSLTSLVGILTKPGSIKKSDLTELWIQGAILRKQAVVLSAQKRNVIGSGSDGNGVHIQSLACRTLYALLGTYAAVYKLPTSHPPDAIKLSLARTIEAILSLEQYPVVCSDNLIRDSRAALLRCAQISTAIIVDTSGPSKSATTQYFESAPKHVADAFWSRYRQLTEVRESPSLRIEAINDSIRVLQSLQDKERQTGKLAVRYEELARVHEHGGDLSRAKESLQSAIEIQIAQGRLKEACEASLSSTNPLIWDDTKTSYHILGQNLADRVRLGLRIGASCTDICYDPGHLQPFERAIISERQILILVSHADSPLGLNRLRALVQATLACGSDKKYQTYRLRFVSHLLQLLQRTKQFSIAQIFDHGQIDGMLSELPSSEAHLAQLRPMLLPAIRSQVALSTGNLDENLAESLVGQYSSVVSNLKEANNLYSPDIILAQLTALSDYAGVLGRSDVQAEGMKTLCKLQELIKPANSTKHAVFLSRAALSMSPDGDTVAARKMFIRAEKVAKANSTTSSAHLTIMLDRAEYFLNVGKLEESSMALDGAQTAIDACSTDNQPSERKAQFEKRTWKARHTFLGSKLAFAQNDFEKAYTKARHATKMSAALWESVERASKQSPVSSMNDSELSLGEIVEDMKMLALSTPDAPRIAVHGTMFWAQISLYRSSLQHLAAVSSHTGLYLETMYYAKQASLIANQTACELIGLLAQSEVVLVYAGAGDMREAQAVLNSLTSTVCKNASSLEQCILATNLAEAFWLVGDVEQSKQMLNHTQSYYRQLKRLLIDEETPLPTTVTPRKKRPLKSAPVRQVAKTVRLVARTKEPQTPMTEIRKGLTLGQQDLYVRIQSLQCRHGTTSEGTSIVNLTGAETQTPVAVVTRALTHFQRAIESFASDPVSSSLGETTLAIPVRYKAARKSGQMSLLLDESMATPVKPRGKPVKSVAPFKTNSKPAQTTNSGQQLLIDAYNALKTLITNKTSALPAHLVHTMHKAFSELALLSTALGQPIRYSPLHVVMQSMVSNDVARARERITIASEGGLDLSKITKASSIEDMNEIVSILPSSWRVVSIGLSHDQSELLLCKISPGVSPFLIRLPLARAEVEDVDEQDYSFKVILRELADIMKRANETSHDIRGQGDKKMRQEWQQEREALDKQMKNLLATIENIWLGGFRGLLSSQEIDTTVLARFGSTLDLALDKHLPSRKKSAKTRPPKIELHARVLELFVSMEMEDTMEFEDSITDLLCFVIDLLSHNGERNAMDEIDFDALLVDVLDALKGYHHTLDSISNITPQTILILDKDLHSIPWESLPCLIGRPIYRMPSLGAILERVHLLRSGSSTAQSFSISTRQGAYILNPSSDLTSTQTTFSPILSSQLPHYTTITNRPPTEPEFKSFLTTFPLLLYFGHGSGAQYIHRRTIRSLQTQGDNCAVTWLMGCSSLHMQTHGTIFEPSGMPWHYLNGGCNAVVGTLWDVTDRDIDRFSLRALVEWGLLNETEETRKVLAKKKAKVGGKAKLKEEQIDRKKETMKGEKVAIGEAVALGRKACLLEYLNGASTVVYGVPVTLE